jgi:UDP-N-acetyl-L-fucosamine synthase
LRKNIKVITILGTRPEIIRLSRIIYHLDKHMDHILVHTGQNYDYELNEIFIEELNIRKPDYFLEVGPGSVGKTIAEIIKKTEEIINQENPDAILILGDTNSSLSAIIAKRMKIPIYHMEAGNRSFDANVPEEINRRIVDHISDFNLVYTEHSRRHLLSEGLPHRRIYLTGSPLKEVLDYYKPKYSQSKILKQQSLETGQYFLVSIHREENVDNPKFLKNILDTLEAIVDKYSLPIIVSTHPRTRDRLKRFGNVNLNENIKLFKPFGYFDYLQLQINAKCTISDSGTISEESAILNFPAITIRNSMERPEALDAGTILLSGLGADEVLNAIEITLEDFKSNKVRLIPAEYLVENASIRVLKIIAGTAKLSNNWDGVVAYKGGQ